MIALIAGLLLLIMCHGCNTFASCCVSMPWDQHNCHKTAEQACMQALASAEKLSGGGESPHVGLVLALLAHTYAQSKRITIAEGLHRCDA